MRSPTLSYVMPTRNKLTFLRHTLPRLLSNLRDDEEVVIVDGASTDGTTEHLQDLYAQGKIDQFLSEPDKGEAHAENKAMLLAKGELLKTITDDDVFHYPALQRCKEYMLANPEVDILGSDGGMAHWGKAEPWVDTRAGREYETWVQQGRPFMFGGPGMVLRRRSLPLLGLLSTGLISVDYEYSRRVCTLPICMAWCSLLSFVHIRNPASNEVRHLQRCLDEERRLKRFYNCEDPLPPLRYRLWQRLTRPVRRTLRPIKRLLVGEPPQHPWVSVPVTDQLVQETMESYNAWLDKQNESLQCSFRKSVRGPQ